MCFRLGVAGFVVALTRILTKLVITNDRVSTFFFLLMSVCYIAASYAFHSMTINSPFVLYHTKQCARIVLRPDEDRVLVTILTYTGERNRFDMETAIFASRPMKPPPSMESFRWTPPRHRHRCRLTITITMRLQLPRRRASASAIPSTSSPTRVPARVRWTASTICRPPKPFWPLRSFANTRPLRVLPTRWSTS